MSTHLLKDIADSSNLHLQDKVEFQLAIFNLPSCFKFCQIL